MTYIAAGTLLARIPAVTAAFAILASAATLHQQGPFLHLLIRFGLIGIFLVSIVDSSFVPLPIPGITDILLVLFAAQRSNIFWLVLAATVGSAIGGYLSYKVGHAGGMQFLEKHVPRRIFKRVCLWMENHALLSVALPALLPPPMPLSPFVLAAGVLNMSTRRFLSVFTVSRALRHIIAVGLGIYYGRQVLGLLARFSERWATPILAIIWSLILIGCGLAFWKIYQTTRSFRAGSTQGGSAQGGSPEQDPAQPKPASTSQVPAA